MAEIKYFAPYIFEFDKSARYWRMHQTPISSATFELWYKKKFGFIREKDNFPREKLVRLFSQYAYEKLCCEVHILEGEKSDFNTRYQIPLNDLSEFLIYTIELLVLQNGTLIYFSEDKSDPSKMPMIAANGFYKFITGQHIQNNKPDPIILEETRAAHAFLADHLHFDQALLVTLKALINEIMRLNAPKNSRDYNNDKDGGILVEA